MSAWFGIWTQLLDHNGKKVVVFLPEDQTGLQDKRSEFITLVEKFSDKSENQQSPLDLLRES